MLPFTADGHINWFNHLGKQLSRFLENQIIVFSVFSKRNLQGMSTISPMQ